MRGNLVAVACVIALFAGCGPREDRTDARRAQDQAWDAGTGAQSGGAYSLPSLSPGELGGQWQLSLPQGQQQMASITPMDASQVQLQAGILSGTYVVQGPHLLILTHDERMRPLAWQINDRNTLMLVRSADASVIGADLTGATLTRAAGAMTPAPQQPAAPQTWPQGQQPASPQFPQQGQPQFQPQGQQPSQPQGQQPSQPQGQQPSQPFSPGAPPPPSPSR